MNKHIFLSIGSVAQLKHPRKFWPKAYTTVKDNLEGRYLTQSKSSACIYQPPDLAPNQGAMPRMQSVANHNSLFNEALRSCPAISLPFNSNFYKSENNQPNHHKAPSQESNDRQHNQSKNVSISTFVHEELSSQTQRNRGGTSHRPLESTENFASQALEEVRAPESLHGSAYNQSQVSMRNVGYSAQHESMLKAAQDSIAKTRQYMNNNNTLLTNGSNTEIKFVNPEDSQDSKQLDIVISKDKMISHNADSVHKIQELEKETEKLDLIKMRFEETL